MYIIFNKNQINEKKTTQRQADRQTAMQSGEIYLFKLKFKTRTNRRRAAS